jgi:hypothetical protein
MMFSRNLVAFSWKGLTSVLPLDPVVWYEQKNGDMFSSGHQYSSVFCEVKGIFLKKMIDTNYFYKMK